MSLAGKAYTTLALVFVIGLPALLAALAYSPLFWAVVLAVALASGVYLMSLKCPHCGYHVMHRPLWRNVGPKFWHPLPPKTCPNCGRVLE